MKAIISSIILFLFSFSGNGQVDTSIVGVWKIVSIEMAGIHYNFKKDSISVSDEIKPLTDDAKKEQVVGLFKMVYASTEFHFEKNGILRQKLMGEIILGSYKIDTLQSVIEMTSKNSLNEDATQKVKYNLKKGLLYLFMDLEDEMANVVLQKE